MHIEIRNTRTITIARKKATVAGSDLSLPNTNISAMSCVHNLYIKKEKEGTNHQYAPTYLLGFYF